MRLVDLDPRWVSVDGRSGVGVSFVCPHCAPTGYRLAVLFANPIDGGSPVEWGNQPTWKRTGETFDGLTLSPSIDASRSGHWHGFITSGEAR